MKKENDKLLQEIYIKVCIIEEKLNNMPTLISCERRHNKQKIFNIIIAILLILYVFNDKLFALLKLFKLF